MLVALAIVVLAEWSSARLLSKDPRDEDEIDSHVTVRRPPNVTAIIKHVERAAPPRPEPAVWLMGNSHTYTFPGMTANDEPRFRPEGILIDVLANRYSREYPRQPAHFYLVTYPNLLPFEMLTCAEYLLSQGHRPQLVLLGLTWRNIARDSQLRYELFELYRDPEFCQAMHAALSDPAVAAPDILLREVELQERRARHEAELERTKSDADRLDELLTGWAGDSLTLMGRSAALRVRLYRALTYQVQRAWDDRTTVKYTYDLIERDFHFNVSSLRTLIRVLKQHGATVCCYLAPERTDLPPMMDPERQEQFIRDFGEEAKELGITLFDARNVVPNDYWGWLFDSPDRSHFTEPGHHMLADFLFDQCGSSGAWKQVQTR